jgi:hypothetical protein
VSDTSAAIEEGAKKSGVLWLTLDRPHLAWHTWHDGSIYLVTGGGEQHLPGLDGLDTVKVTLRSKDNGVRLVEFESDVRVVDQATAPDAVAALAKDRLNAPDSEHLTDRWARESTVLRLTPR